MNNKDEKKKKYLPVPIIIITDILLIGLSFLIFSLIHFILPSDYDTDLSKNANNTPTPPRITATSDVNGPTATPEPDSDNPGNVDLSGWGAKFTDKFTDGEIIKDENSYKSKDVNITITKVEKDGITYYIQDIYIRKIECFRTAFAKDAFGRGRAESVLTMAINNDAIIAINGDHYGMRIDHGGVVIRNGYLYKGVPDNEVGVLYYNGEFKTFTAEDFNVDKAMADGAYQSWCFGPGLLTEDGKAKENYVTGVFPANPRTAIGYYEPGHYVFVVVEGRPGGMTMKQLGELFESLGCKAAYNLDGGQSSIMTFNGKLVNQPAGGGRSCSDLVFISEWDED